MSFLDALQPNELETVQRYFQAQHFPSGACLTREGEQGDSCYLIDEGEVRLELTDIETDSDGVLGYVSPGMFLGEFSLLDGAPALLAWPYREGAYRWRFLLIDIAVAVVMLGFILLAQ